MPKAAKPRARKGRTPGAGARLSGLLDRVATLEERVGRIESGKAGPGDGRASVAKAGRKVVRCPGCGLPLRARKGRCGACARPLDR